ncbi:MAG: hypothetical protein K2W82_14080 [Candidatus Obscuribacterales bacterium]|nr:hypothetical protein [Candidatus Obscuribacterales bacterium]
MLSSIQIATAKTLMEEGLAEYKAGRYTLAVVSFSAAAAREPGKQIPHYYLANALVRLKEHARALEEYKISYQINPDSPAGEYSRQAILGYKKPLPSPNDPDFIKTYIQPAKVASAETFSYPPELEKARNIIRRQANIEKSKHRSQSSERQKTSRSIALAEIRRIEQKAEYDIQRLSDPLIFTPEPRANPLLSDPEALRRREDAIKKAAAEEKEYILRQADERTETYNSWQKGKESALDEVASNLETQMEQPVGRSGVKLQAKGTDLYVRNYSQANSKTPDTRQAVVRIVSHDMTVVDDNDNSLEGVLAKPILDPRYVHGKLLRK